MALTPTTEIEAVNQMLRAIGESPTSTIYGDVGADVATARQTLETVSRDVQKIGWNFNTEYNYPLHADADGYVNVPGNALKVDAIRSGSRDIVHRGARLYDRKSHTYKIDGTVKVRIILLLPFEELAETARSYITYRACRTFQDESLGAEETHRYTLRGEVQAQAAFESEQTVDEDLNFIRDDPDFNPL